MSLESIANKKSCSGSNDANTGKLGCLSLLSTPTHLIAVTKGFIIPKATDFDVIYMEPLVQDGTFTPLIDATAFEDTSSEDAYTTSTSGIKRLNLKGLPEFKLMFEEGHEFYRQMAKLTSYKSYDFIIGDNEGNWAFAKTSSGDFKGFSAGHVTAEMRKSKVAGGDAESKSLLIQFLDRLQWDENYAIMHSDQLTFTPQEVPVVNGCIVAYTVLPADTDVDLSVSVKLASDNDSLVEGLIIGDFKATRDGVLEAITGVVEITPGNYDLTIAAIVAGEIIGADLYDIATPSQVVINNSILYRSEEIFEVASA